MCALLWFVCHTAGMPTPATDAPRPAVPTARARARAALIGDIKDEARRQLGEAGAAGLSVRAVARALGMAPSATYRYFPSREDLLTALIIDAYDSLGAAAEQAEAAVARADHVGRFLAIGRAVRAWALAHPAEYALVYGSPVPGYRAPQDTVGPATRVTVLLAGVLQDGWAAGVVTTSADDPPVSGGLEAELARLAEFVPGVPVAVLVKGLVAWTQLFGLVNFELFGQFQNTIDDPTELADQSLRLMARFMGFTDAD